VAAALDGYGFEFPPNLTADKLGRFLDTLRTGPKRLSVQTTNDYLQAIGQFARWLAENDRIEKTPFAGVKKGNPERDRRHVRRFLDGAELRSLVASALTSPTTFRRLTGEDRAILYAVAAATGYRAGELAVLTPEGFRLDADPPTIDLDGEFTKNGRRPASRSPGTWPGDWPRSSRASRPAIRSGRERGRTGRPT
jgi:site-specific recombinase XerC